MFYFFRILSTPFSRKKAYNRLKEKDLLDYLNLKVGKNFRTFYKA